MAVTKMVWLILILAVSPAAAQDTVATYATGDSITVQFADADLRSVVQALGRHLPKPVLVSGIPSVRVSLAMPAPVSRGTLAILFKELIESQNLEFIEDSAFIRIGPKPPLPVERAVTPGIPARGPQGPTRLFVIRLKHARAADVAATVNLLFGSGGDFSGGPGRATGTLSEELRRKLVAPESVGQLPAANESGARSATLNGAVTIVPDQLTNSLLVRASEEDHALLVQAVDQLDIRPLQVLIEVLIVEARQDRSFSLGADITVPPQNLGDGTISGTLRGGGLGDLVVRLMNLGSPDINAVLRLAHLRGDVEIVSRPVLLASNNTEARFLVGSQQPFVQVSRSLPTDTPSRDQVVQYQDVGTKLTVRPTINQDGYVSLAIQQEISAATGETQFDAPVISTREAVTQVLVRDGQTIVLGGLRDRQRDRGQSGIPILSQIPIIGGLFGRSSRRSTATELYLFLTPRILRTDAEVDSVTAPRLKASPR